MISFERNGRWLVVEAEGLRKQVSKEKRRISR